MDEFGTVVVDCEAGRGLGCQTLCCQLFVPLSINELGRGLQTQSPLSTLLRHDLDGYCSYFDRTTLRCTIWDERPLVCRRYNCNNDPKLQVVLREGMTSFGRLIEQAKRIPISEWQRIPLLPAPSDDKPTKTARAKGRRRKRAGPKKTPVG